MFVVDTNILFYSTDTHSPSHAKCKALIERLRAGATPWFATWGILYEFLRISTHPKVLRNPLTPSKAWDIIESFFASPSFRILIETERHRHIAQQIFSDIPDLTGNWVFDARTAILMQENGIKTIYTRDTDFNRFPFIDTIDPATDSRRTAGS